MSRKEARAKGWNTWKENLINYANEHPEFSLEDFILQRAYTAFFCWREARLEERNHNFERARGLYLKASESLEQTEKLKEHPQLPPLLEKLKNEYYDFVVHRDPIYRLKLKHPLLWIKEHSGILQTELYKKFPNHKREDITYALYFAEKEGLIRREEKGRSYQLFFIRDKTDEPFLKLEEDEIDIQEKTEQEAALKKGCLYIFTFLFWFFAIVVAWAVTGIVGAGIAVAAFIVWLIVRKILQKKRNSEMTTQPLKAISPPDQLENSEHSEETDEKNM